MKPRRGIQLAETVVAIFILVYGLLLSTNLFSSGLRYSSRVEQQAEATLIAQKKLAEIRAWAAIPKAGGGYNFDDWSVYAGVTTNDPVLPEYQITVNASPSVLLDADSTEQAMFAPPYQRRLSTTFEKVTVTVALNSGSPVNRCSLTTLVADPARDWRAANPLVITLVAGSSPLSQNGTITFSVQGFDSDGLAIRDLMCHWYVVPMTGNGTITDESGDGSQVTLTHKVQLPDGAWGFAPPASRCALMARAVYRGKERTASVIVNLN